jgi:hypothetical protein
LDPAVSGGIKGVIQTADTLQRVIAFEPFEVKAYQGKLDKATGAFIFQGLPPGEYDLLIKTVGHVYEGISLTLMLEQPLPAAKLEDAADGVSRTFFDTEDYFNIKRIVRLTSDGQRAAMLVMQTRTRPVVEPSGETLEAYVRRFDFVDLVKTNKVWQIVTSRHLLRQEVPYGSDDAQVRTHYSPKLGGMLVGKAVKDLGEVDLERLPAGDDDRYVSRDYEAK